jgi:hypothetical protein
MRPLRGTLYTPEDSCNRLKANTIRHKIKLASEFAGASKKPMQQILRQLDYSRKKLQTAVGRNMDGKGGRL